MGDLVWSNSGHVNFSEAEPTGAEGAAGLLQGAMTFSDFLGGGRGTWYQPRRGALLARARYKRRSYYFVFLPSMAAFQAMEAAPGGEMGSLAFKAPQVSM